MATSGGLLEEALCAAGGRETFDRKYRQYEESIAFIDKNREKLLKKYDESWVAVYEGRVVGHAKKYEDLEKNIRHGGLPIEEVVVKFLTSRRMLTLF